MRYGIDRKARLDFALKLRSHWAYTLFPTLRSQYASHAAPVVEVQLEQLVRSLPAYPWFAWLERGSQKMLWRAVTDAVESNNSKIARAEAFDELDDHLELNEALEMPDWYTDWDIHLQPGGVWSGALSAEVYELGAKLVMLSENDDYRFHRLFVETAVPEREYERIVDLGCGFGKSTWPFKKAFPQAEVIGVDLSEPCLRLAARRGLEQQLAIRWKQADATATGLDDESCDLVTSTMLIHEMPVMAIGAMLAEAARILKPGGLVRCLDFRFTGDFLRDMAMREHGLRNNEPYLPGALAADVTAMAEEAGLSGARWVAFDERGAGRLAASRWPERPEWHFPWAVLEAEKTQ